MKLNNPMQALFIIPLFIVSCTTADKYEMHKGSREIAQEVDHVADENKTSVSRDDIPPLNLQPDDWQLPVPDQPKSKLFRSNKILNLIIRGPFPVERNENQDIGREGFEIRYTTKSGKEKIIPIKVAPRGKSRAGFCDFTPLRLIWGEDKERDNTIFDHLKGANMKLVVHCRYTAGTIAENSGANDSVLKEYALYKVLKAWGLPIFEVRLAKIQYQDQNGDNLVEGFGFFVEPNASLAARYKLKHLLAKKRIPGFVDTRVMLPYYLSRLIVNATDYYLDGHNTEYFLNENHRSSLLVPYDFNDSALVNGRDYKFGAFRLEALSYVKAARDPRDGAQHVHSEEWTRSFFNYAQALVARKEFVLEYLGALPLRESAKEEFASHMLKFSSELEGMLEEHPKQNKE